MKSFTALHLIVGLWLAAQSLIFGICIFIMGLTKNFLPQKRGTKLLIAATFPSVKNHLLWSIKILWQKLIWKKRKRKNVLELESVEIFFFFNEVAAKCDTRHLCHHRNLAVVTEFFNTRWRCASYFRITDTLLCNEICRWKSFSKIFIFSHFK